ncbi:mechanosensitive ion channel family protein [Halorubrum sp. CSM-61]|uniref:mechanosensitive ion channel family protein n=1 Tax=Halorubrum sp. CSM-61 TaxID=2485838 RepID=UPI001F14A3EA|nr:mechanosensitive ion channel family protein [Halorubrum sp. CSM-61]
MIDISPELEILLQSADDLPFSNQPWMLVIAILIGAYVLSRLIEWGGHKLLDQSDRWPDDSINRIFFEEIHMPLYVSVALGGIYGSLSVLGFVESSYYLVGAILSILVVLWMRAAIRVGSQWIEAVNATESDYEFSPIFKNFWTILLLIGTVISLLIIWEINVTPFLASAGIIGIILGLAAQEAIGNLIGGVSLYFDDTYKTGDVIILEDGQRGTVTDIGIRSTTVLTRDNILITVPNAVLNSASVVNESAPQRRKRIRVPITVAYGTDYQKVEEILLGVCDEIPLLLESPSPRVMFREFGDSALVFELWAFVAHPFSELRAIDQINRLVYDEFDEADIVIPFPQREISFLDSKQDVTPQQPVERTYDEEGAELSRDESNN